MPTVMSLENPPFTNTTLGLFGNGDADFPGYVGASSAYFSWAGLSSGAAMSMIAEWWASLNKSGAPGPGDFPTSGALFTTYPQQILQVAEQVSDFGSVSDAQNWMASQRQEHQPNTIPDYGDGVQDNPAVALIYDDTFVYRIDYGAPYSSLAYTGPYLGDVYTNIEVRQQQIIYAIAIDAAPAVDAVSVAVSLMQKLTANESGVCVVPTPLPDEGSPTPPPSLGGSLSPSPTTSQSPSGVSTSSGDTVTTPAAH